MSLSSHLCVESFTAQLTIHLSILADRDPQLAIRVLQRFAERGELPQKFSAQLDAEDGLRLELHFEADREGARLLARRLENLPSVRTVALSYRHRFTAARTHSALAQSA